MQVFATFFFVSLLLFQYFKGHCAAEPLVRLKVRGERLKAGDLCFALNLVLFYVVAQRAKIYYLFRDHHKTSIGHL